MSKTVEARNGDIALFLYAAPFILNFLYALYLWGVVGFSATLPQLVYLKVTQSPYIFLLGFVGVVLAALIDFNSEAPDARKNAVAALSRRLQWIALLSVVLAFIAAWYSAGGDIATGLLNVVDGRYPLVFPALLVFFSFLMLPSVKLQGANMKNLLVVLLLIASPAALYELGKRSTVAGLGVSMILFLVAAFLLVRGKKD